MQCDACGSDDSLFVVVSGISHGETRLCRVCALEKGYAFNEGEAALPHVDSILDTFERLDEPVEAEAACPECGMARELLAVAGSLGCPVCVQIFRHQFLMARKRRGLPAGYAGKVPRNLARCIGRPDPGLDTDAPVHTKSATVLIPGAFDGSRLLADMESAVLAEDFEKAALLRDRLGSVRKSGYPHHEA